MACDAVWIAHQFATAIFRDFNELIVDRSDVPLQIRFRTDAGQVEDVFTDLQLGCFFSVLNDLCAVCLERNDLVRFATGIEDGVETSLEPDGFAGLRDTFELSDLEVASLEFLPQFVVLFFFVPSWLDQQLMTLAL